MTKTFADIQREKINLKVEPVEVPEIADAIGQPELYVREIMVSDRKALAEAAESVQDDEGKYPPFFVEWKYIVATVSAEVDGRSSYFSSEQFEDATSVLPPAVIERLFLKALELSKLDERTAMEKLIGSLSDAKMIAPQVGQQWIADDLEAILRDLDEYQVEDYERVEAVKN